MTLEVSDGRATSYAQAQETLLLQVVLTEVVERDLEDIVTHIARHDSPQSAEHPLGRIRDIAGSFAAAEEGRRGKVQALRRLLTPLA